MIPTVNLRAIGQANISISVLFKPLSCCRQTAIARFNRLRRAKKTANFVGFFYSSTAIL